MCLLYLDHEALNGANFEYMPSQCTTMHITVDLDDTLIASQQDYDEAIVKLGNWISQETNSDPAIVTSRIREIDQKNLSSHGLNKERFLISFEQAVEEFFDEASAEDRTIAREIGSTAFKPESEYRARGFKEGADELLTRLSNAGVTTHLVTAGDETVQQRKIDALELERRFDYVDIVGLNEKAEILRSMKEEFHDTEIKHIGNSYSSDVTAAIDAGVSVIYIPDGEWRRNKKQNIDQHDLVTVFESIPELLKNFNSIFDVPQSQSYIVR